MMDRPKPEHAALVSAIHQDDAEGVRGQLGSGVWSWLMDPDMVGEAISMGSPRALAELASHAAGLPGADEMKAKIHMKIACLQGRVEACEILLSHGWPMDAQSLAFEVLGAKKRSSGRRVSPMDKMRTCRFPGMSEGSKATWGSLLGDSFEWLVPRVPDVDAAMGGASDGSLTMLMLSGDARCAKALLERGANPNLVDKKGWTATAYAIQFGSKEWIQALIEGGADLGQVAPGWSAVEFAVSQAGRSEAAQWALAAARAAIEKGLSNMALPASKSRGGRL